MRIIQLLPWHSISTKGGTEIYILNLSKQIINANHEVLIICPSNDLNTKKFSVEGINVIETPSIIMDQPPSVDLGIEEPIGFQDFIFFLESLKPDVLHFHCFWRRHIYYLEAAKKLNIKTIITPHLALFSCLQSNLMFENKVECDGILKLKKCANCLIQAKDSNWIIKLIISISSEKLNRLKINLDEKSTIGRNLNIFNHVESLINVFKRINKSVDYLITISQWYYDVLLGSDLFESTKLRLIKTEMAAPEILELEKQKKAITSIAFVGRLSYEKGIHLLLEAVSSLPYDLIELHLFGKMTDQNIEKQIQYLMLRKYKIFSYSEVEHKELMINLSKMDLLCVPSLTIEMSPLVVNEALSHKVPVIGANRGGIKDLIKDGINGILFNYNDAKDLLKKLEMLVLDKSKLDNLNRSWNETKQNRSFIESHLNLYEFKK